MPRPLERRPRAAAFKIGQVHPFETENARAFYALMAAEEFASALVAAKPRDPLAKCKFFKNKTK
ncbi:protein of unknown function [Candidatus Methylocalor cossyra]|uniref:Uncharacterized protein n=1 Tax=Candidatus Methylocalor cossyra TaxID=3108543 RepID=A0ABM9NFP0_9GAMM